jgi:hypothetical protein
MALKTIPEVHCASSVPTFNKHQLRLKDTLKPIHKTLYLSEIKKE